ncbi:MAG TPA: HD domain-containing phosphohydrolase [Abditibacteriaceae bacterium]
MTDEAALQLAKILIVDDEEANVRLLERTLQRWGYTNLITTNDSREALPLFEQHRPDLILLDLMMPHIDGFTVMESINSLLPEGVFLPILVLTADANPQVKRRALSAGAKDFLTKPFDQTELLLRIMNMLETRFLHIELANQNQILEQKVVERTKDLAASQIEILDRLARAAEYRDDDTGQHTYRVGHVAALIAQKLNVPTSRVELIRRASPLHDVGKIGVPDNILLKPGRLTPEEFDIIKPHTTIGAALLSGGHSEMVKIAETIALTHHERWDGTGYPAGLKGEEIPLEGRIVAIADVFDALSHDRPYKKAWPLEECVAEIERNSGRQFDSQVVAAFLELWNSGALREAAEMKESPLNSQPMRYEVQREAADAVADHKTAVPSN